MNGTQAGPLMGVEIAEPGMRMPGFAFPVASILGDRPGIVVEELAKLFDDLLPFAALRFHVGDVGLSFVLAWLCSRRR